MRSWMGGQAAEGPGGDTDSCALPTHSSTLTPQPNPFPAPLQLIKAEEETGLLSPRLNCSKYPGAGLWTTEIMGHN